MLKFVNYVQVVTTRSVLKPKIRQLECAGLVLPTVTIGEDLLKVPTLTSVDAKLGLYEDNSEQKWLSAQELEPEHPPPITRKES